MSDDITASGRILLRISPPLHAALRAAAEATGLSLNEYCARRLGTGGTVTGPAADAVRKAAALAGEALVGVIAFGSWARGEAGEESDVDLLVVLDRETPLGRDLYHEWDEEPLRWDSMRVEPHFVHLPESDTGPSGLWAEAAVDGVVLFERDLEVSRWLAAVRREIADGRLVRRWSHGQPYWIHEPA